MFFLFIKILTEPEKKKIGNVWKNQIDIVFPQLHGGSKYTEQEEPQNTPAQAIEQMNIKLDKRSMIFQTLNGVLGMSKNASSPTCH